LIKIRAAVVVLDLDDTLYLERDFARSGYEALAAQFGERIGGPLFARECRALLEKGARGNIFDLALSRCGIETSPELIAELVEHYRSHRPEIRFCPDASRFLDRLGKVATALITDGPRQAQAAKAWALELDSCLDHVIITGEWSAKYSKPHPRAFELVESLTGRSRSELVYIADNGAKDFLAPRRLGWQTVQLLRTDRIHDGVPPSRDHEADSVVGSFDEIGIATSVDQD